jgi:hypothetical protein
MLIRKILLPVYVLISLSVFSQDENTLKASAKSVTAEVNFNPFSSNPININYIRLRKFIDEKHAARLGISMGYNTQTQVKDIKLSSFDFNLRPGYEIHFNGTDRLSPYYGFDIDLAIKNSKRVDNIDNNGIKEIKGAWDGFGTERGFFRVGGNILVGADYYIARRLYLGTEFGYGFQLLNFSDVVQISESGNTISETIGGSAFQIAPNFNSSIRLGFVF